MVEALPFKAAFSGFGLLFAVVGLGLLWKGRTARARSKRIEATDPTPVADLRPGTVEVTGTAEPGADGAVMQSPLSGADALVSQVTVEEYRSGGKNSSGSWHTLHEETETAPLLVDDGTGQVRVAVPPEAGVNLDMIRTRVGGGEEPPAPVREYVESRADVDEATRYDLGLLSVGDRRRYSEGVIEPGEAVFVRGGAREESGWDDPAYAIDEPTPAGDFVLSDKSEQELVQEGKIGGVLLLAVGGAFTGMGSLFALVPWLAF